MHMEAVQHLYEVNMSCNHELPTPGHTSVAPAHIHPFDAFPPRAPSFAHYLEVVIEVRRIVKVVRYIGCVREIV